MRMTDENCNARTSRGGWIKGRTNNIVHEQLQVGTLVSHFLGMKQMSVAVAMRVKTLQLCISIAVKGTASKTVIMDLWTKKKN